MAVLRSALDPVAEPGTEHEAVLTASGALFGSTAPVAPTSLREPLGLQC